MRWALLPDTNLNLRYKALDESHLLFARAHIQVHFAGAELMKISYKQSHVILKVLGSQEQLPTLGTTSFPTFKYANMILWVFVCHFMDNREPFFIRK